MDMERKPSLYAQYVKERLGKDVIENDDGFCTLVISNDCFYIEEIFVQKESRREGVAQKFADEACAWAKRLGYKEIIGSVNIRAKNPEYSAHVLHAYGFRMFKAHDGMILYKKEIY